MFGRLKSYTVHIRPDRPTPYQEPVLVREGFYFLAAVIPPLWALFNRLWLPAIVLIALSALLKDEARFGLTELGGTLIAAVIGVMTGYLAADLKRARLRRLGYITADIVVAPSEMAARHRFYERYAHAL